MCKPLTPEILPSDSEAIQALKRTWRRHQRNNWLYRHGRFLFIREQAYFSGMLSNQWYRAHVDPEVKAREWLGA